MSKHEAIEVDEELLRGFMKSLLDDVRALELMLDSPLIESGVRRIGAEQEMFLITPACRPAPVVTEILDRINDKRFVTEVGRFNMECNLAPQMFGGQCLRQLELELEELLKKAREKAHEIGAEVFLVGILPTIRQSDLGIDNMVPNPRYYSLNRTMARLRGGAFHVLIKGLDELDVKHDNVMLEACNTSFQVHFQVGAKEFAKLYNVAQAVTAPVLAAAVNSPFLLGSRLWHETRVATFQQSVDVRSQAHLARGSKPRVHFGDSWIKQSVIEIFREDIARYRILLATGIEENSLELVKKGVAPNLSALRLHNGTIYRWNRACYGVSEGIAHLRIEMRVLPAGPTIVDEIANAAFYYGLMVSITDEYDDVTKHMAFDDAKSNFLAAARHGLKAQLTWFDGHTMTARDLILDELLPRARKGLAKRELDAGDIDRYLGVLEDRVRSGQTGAQWLLSSYAAMGEQGTKDQRLRALTRQALGNQLTGQPVHTWPVASKVEGADWRDSFRTVGQFMKTEVFTVRPWDLVDLAAAMMDWEHIRHVPVEDDQGHLVGIISHRQLLRLVGQGLREGAQPVQIESIMKRDLVTATPETRTLDAMHLMRERRVGCLPIVKDEKLVGIVTEKDFVEVAVKVLVEQLREE